MICQKMGRFALVLLEVLSLIEIGKVSGLNVGRKLGVRPNLVNAQFCLVLSLISYANL